jgi:hypothetical protein
LRLSMVRFHLRRAQLLDLCWKFSLPQVPTLG